MTKEEWFELTKTGKLTQEHINQWLLEGNSINEQDFYGYNTLMTACSRGYYTIVQLLIDSGSDMNHQDIFGETILMKVCYFGRYEIAQLLIEKGADVNQPNIWGKTVLMHTCEYGHYKTTKLLIQNSANPYIIDIYGKSAYDYGNDEIKKIILEYYPYYLHKCLKKYMIKGDNKILNIKRINLPLNKMV